MPDLGGRDWLLFYGAAKVSNHPRFRCHSGYSHTVLATDGTKRYDSRAADKPDETGLDVRCNTLL